jgi:hypothetical protein
MASKTFASGIMKIYGNEFNEIWNTGEVLVREGEKNLNGLEKAREFGFY